MKIISTIITIAILGAIIATASAQEAAELEFQIDAIIAEADNIEAER